MRVASIRTVTSVRWRRSGNSGSRQVRSDELGQFGHDISEVHVFKPQVEMPAVGQRHRAQVLNQPRETIDLEDQPPQRTLVRLEHAVDHALEPAFEDGQRGSQLVRDRCVPERHVGRHVLKALSHEIEVVDELRRFPEGAIAGSGTRRQVAVGDAAGASGERLQRLEDAAREAKGDEDGDRQRQENGDAEDGKVRQREPATVRIQPGIEGNDDGVGEISAEEDDQTGDHGDCGHGEEDLTAETGGELHGFRPSAGSRRRAPGQQPFGAGLLELLAQLAEMTVHGTVERVRPRQTGVDQFAPGEDLRRAARHVGEYAELGQRQRERPVAEARLVGIDINRQVADAQHSRRAGKARAAQHGLGPRHDLDRVERLHHIVVGADA